MNIIPNGFREFIVNLLDRSDMKKTTTDLLRDDSNLQLFLKGFTHSTAFPTHPQYNYEVYEQRGDLTINKFIVNYMYKKFPQLDCPSCLKIVARLRINYGSKANLSKLARNLGFGRFIRASDLAKEKDKDDSLLEDVFESFFGVVEKILDDNFNFVGVGYVVCYKILENIFNEIENISLEYHDLYDSKTILKQMFEDSASSLINYKIEYKDNRLSTGLYNSQVVMIDKSNYLNILNIGEGLLNIKNESQQMAAKNAILFLKNGGIEAKIPQEYISFCDFK